MAITKPNTLPYDTTAANVALATDSFYGMLLDGTYTPNGTHAHRSDLTGEVTGTGYTAGGKALTGLSLTRSGATTTWTFAALVWTVATISARYLAIYKHRGGLASADELIGVDDFGSLQTSSAGTWTYTPNASGFYTET